MKTLLHKLRGGPLWTFGRIFLALMLMNASSSFGFHVDKRPVTVNQPDGTELSIFASGDEYYHWLHDANDYTIVVNDQGYYVYADFQNGELVPTIHQVGTTDPSTTGLKPGLNYSPERLDQFREAKGAYKPRPSYLGGILKAREEAGPNARFDAPTMNPLVIFVRFAGETEFTQTKDYYNGIFNTGTNSMRNYYLWNSYNQLTITSQIVGGTLTNIASYQSPNARSYYQPQTAANPNGYTAANKWTRERALWISAINALKASVPAGLDIDGNNDGAIDEIFFVVRGSNTGWGDILWPHAGGLGSTGITINGATPSAFMCVFETWHDVGLLSHETGHVLGAPDFYRYSDNTITPLSTWEAMSNQTNPPQSMTAYTKLKYMGFINSIPTITQSGYYTLSPLGTSKSAYKIPSTKPGEYFVVEYRSKTASSFESLIPGSGLLIYRVNSAASGNGGGPPDELYVYRPGGTNTTTNGNISQAFYSSNAGRTQLTDATSPNAFMSDNSLGHLNITEIGAAGATITFYYKKPFCLATSVKTVSYTSTSIIPSLTEAIQYIITSGTVTLASGTSRTFRSERVYLEPGFKASSGAYFRATTPNCAPYQPIPAATRVLEDSKVAVSDNYTVESSTSSDGFGNSFDAFPNPAEDFVKVHFNNASEAASVVEVFNASGQKLQTVPVADPSSHLLIDLKGQSPGIYYLKATIGAETATKKIIIK